MENREITGKGKYDESILILESAESGRKYPFIFSCGFSDDGDIFSVDFYDLVYGTIQALHLTYDIPEKSWELWIIDNPYMTKYEHQIYERDYEKIKKRVYGDMRDEYIEKIGKATYRRCLLVGLMKIADGKEKNPYTEFRDFILSNVDKDKRAECGRIINDSLGSMLEKITQLSYC